MSSTWERGLTEGCLVLVSRVEMNNEFRNLETGLSKLEQELKLHYADDNDPEDRFAPVMREFYAEASAEFKRLYLLRNKMNEWYDKVVRYYGEDPAKMHPDEFFGIFKKFTSSWEVCPFYCHGPLFNADSLLAMRFGYKAGSPETRASGKAKETRTRVAYACSKRLYCTVKGRRYQQL